MRAGDIKGLLFTKNYKNMKSLQAHLKQLRRQYPNDMEFGSKVAELLNNLPPDPLEALAIKYTNNSHKEKEQNRILMQIINYCHPRG